MQRLAEELRRQRTARGLSLGRLAAAAGLSKAYLSMIENERLDRPPSPAALASLERALGCADRTLGQLADWQVTPPAVKRQVAQLSRQLQRMTGRRTDGAIDLDALYQSGQLQQRIDHDAGNIDALPGRCDAVPLINQVAAGYPTDFTDLDYPVRVADEYITCPDVTDVQAFAARVVGDSMKPKYEQGDIIVFSPAIEPTDGADCFVRLLPDHHTTFKRVMFEPEDRVRLQPLNSAFPVQVVPLEQISGMYPAVYRMQRL